jgi:uncharacterized protein
MLKGLVMAAALAAAGMAQAQGAAPAPASPAKKELVNKVLTLLQPAVENMAQQLAQQPAAQIQQGAGQALQRVPTERREAVARDIEADLRKYVEEAVPLVRDKAVKLAPGTIGVLLDERFTEDELRQIAALLESPVNRKFQQAFPDMQKALGEKLVAESKAEIEPKVRALDQTVVKRLGLTPPAAAASGAKPAATTPAKK